MRMRQADYERRIAEYSRRLGQRERTALAAFLPLLVALIVTPFVVSGVVSSRVFILTVSGHLTALACVGVWIAARAWRHDRVEGVVAPCPGCGGELAMDYDEVVAEGLCPRCGARAITDAT